MKKTHAFIHTLILTFALLTSFTHLEAKHYYGDLYVEKINRVHDGDTFNVDIKNVHPIIGSGISIRINGIDTPEMTDDRKKIKELACKAKEYLISRLENSKVIQLQNIQRDKYFRILADVYLDGENIALEMINAGYAHPYDGKTKPKWD